MCAPFQYISDYATDLFFAYLHSYSQIKGKKDDDHLNVIINKWFEFSDPSMVKSTMDCSDLDHFAARIVKRLNDIPIDRLTSKKVARVRARILCLAKKESTLRYSLYHHLTPCYEKSAFYHELINELRFL